jgi:outer membrane PBP1 activator LpoA protein
MTATLESIHQQALALSAPDRAALISRLLEFEDADEDEGLAEAHQRMEEGERDPSVWLTEEEFIAGVKAARSR